MKPIKYTLAINQAGSYDLWKSFDSSMPFMSISVGDIINPGLWEGSQSPIKVLRVTKVMHDIFENGDEVRHVIAIFSEEVVRLDEFSDYC